MNQIGDSDRVKNEEVKTDEGPRLGLGSKQSVWRLWLTRVVVFSVTFVLLMTVFSGVADIVESFFVMLYTE